MGGPPATTFLREVLAILCSISWWLSGALVIRVGAFLGGAYSIIAFSRAYHNFGLSESAAKSPLSNLELTVGIYHIFWLLAFF